MTQFQKAHRLKTDGVMKPGGETEQALLSTLSIGQSALAIRAASQAIQNMGRGGDELLVHITPDEARLLDAVTDGGSINPNTGLLEFFWNSDGGWDSKNDPDRNETMRDVERQFDRKLGSDSFGGSKDRGWGNDRDTNQAPSDPTSQSNNAQRMLEEKPKQHPAQAKDTFAQLDDNNSRQRRSNIAAQWGGTPSLTDGFFQKNSAVTQVADASETMSTWERVTGKTPEQKAAEKTYERYIQRNGRPDYVYGGNNLGTRYNNPNGIDASKKALSDSLAAKVMKLGGQTLSTFGPKSAAIPGMLMEDVGRQLEEKIKSPTYDPRTPGYYSPKLDLLR